MSDSLQHSRTTESSAAGSSKQGTDSDPWKAPQKARDLVRRFNAEVLAPARKFLADVGEERKQREEKLASEKQAVEHTEQQRVKNLEDNLTRIRTTVSSGISRGSGHLSKQNLSLSAPSPNRGEGINTRDVAEDQKALSDGIVEAERHARHYSEEAGRQLDETLLKTNRPGNPVFHGAGCGVAIGAAIVWPIVGAITGSFNFGFFVGVISYFVVAYLFYHIPTVTMTGAWTHIWKLSESARASLDTAAKLSGKLHVQILDAVNKKHEALREQARQDERSRRDQLQARLEPIAADIAQNAKQLSRIEGWACLSWDDNAWNAWTPATEPTFCAAFGSHRLNIEDVKKAFARLTLDFSVPAFFPFDDGKGVLVETSGSAKQRAACVVEALAMRLLTVIPPGKARFTFLDPVGLGNSVASLMSLADHDEMLVNSRAWSEPRHIEERLAEITEHIETVIQKYLRQDYKTIHDYNEHAGEVAEPHRFVIVFDFPTNFTDTAARRLVSIAQNGPRCGVYPIVLVDMSKPLPYGFSLEELERHALVAQSTGTQCTMDSSDSSEIEIGKLYSGKILSTTNFGAFISLGGKRDGLIHISELADFRVERTEDVVKVGDFVTAKCIGVDDKGRVKLSRKGVSPESAVAIPVRTGESFIIRESSFQDWIVDFDLAPSPELATRIKEGVGSMAKDASRVEVPYGRLLQLAGLNEGHDWTESTARKIEVPLGPEGARKARPLTFGEGTAHHGLIVGKTGSGKSNLLHIIISTLALKYSPQELQLYLIDFKQGVEFKPYAEHQLPHAFAVAVESEREFALSVMERLDQELKQRGELFRSVGAANIAEYRAKAETKGESLPRIILIVDEFQEFFREDDDLSRRVSGILNQLVLQGRSNGLHVLLGTQSLANVHGVSRGTFDQMGVRIALQCSEADSRLILADDNPAARLLSRPGEAIYNDQGGLIEGNKPFQVAMFSEDEREAVLAGIRNKAIMVAEEEKKDVNTPIVFAGNELAHIETSKAIKSLMDGSQVTAESKTLNLWIGEPVAIRPTICARLTRQSGSHMLIISRHEEEASGMALAALLSALSQRKADDVRVVIANFLTPETAPADLVAELSSLFRYPIKVLTKQRDLAAEVRCLADESKRRGENASNAPTTLVFLLGLQRMKTLREDDDSQTYEDISDLPSSFFAQLVKDGPESGVHIIATCDTVGNASRSFERRLMNQVGLRVAAVMPEPDSNSFLDSPTAAKLDKPHRAIFFDESRPGLLEKFIPFGLPKREFLEKMAAHLQSREERVT